MILADTSVWVDYLRGRKVDLSPWLDRNEVLAHPFVVGELMLGGLRRNHPAIRELRQLPVATLAAAEEVGELIESWSLDGCGIGYVDAALLASVRLEPGSRLWTLDRKLRAVAAGMALSFES